MRFWWVRRKAPLNFRSSTSVCYLESRFLTLYRLVFTLPFLRSSTSGCLMGDVFWLVLQVVNSLFGMHRLSISKPFYRWERCNDFPFYFSLVWFEIYFHIILISFLSPSLLFFSRQAHDSPIRAAQWSKSGYWLISSDQHGTIKYFQPNMNNLQAFQGSREAIRGLSFSPDDQRFVSASDDSILRIWKFDEAREESVLKGESIM